MSAQTHSDQSDSESLAERYPGVKATLESARRWNAQHPWQVIDLSELEDDPELPPQPTQGPLTDRDFG